MSSVSKDSRTKARLLEENEELRRRLDEAEQTLEAIRSGNVDALVVADSRGEQIYTLTGAEHVYRVIVETMNEAALTVDTDGTVLFCNQRFCDLMKTPMEETLGRSIAGFVAPPQRPPFKRLMADAQTAPVQRRITLQAADGTTVPVQLSASLLYANGSISVCLVASDLTELEASANSIRVLREHEQTLEESEERYRRFFMEDLAGDFLATPEGKVIECNPAFAEIYGFASPAEAAARCDISQFNPGDWSELMSHVKAWGRVQKHESVHHRPDGCTLYVVANVVGQFSEAGELTKINGYLFDDTERKLAELALQETNARLEEQRQDLLAANEQLITQQEELRLQAEELVEANERLRELKDQAERTAREMEWLGRMPRENPHPVFRISLDYRVLYRNAAAEELCHLWVCDWEQEVPPAVRDLILAAQAGQEAVYEEVVGGDRTYLLTVAPFVADGYVNVYAQDITDRKRMEEKLRKNEYFLRLAQEITRVGTFEWNIVTGVSTWTPELESLYGLPPGGFPGTRSAWEQLVHPEDRAQALAAVQRAFETSETVEDEWRVIWPDGSIHWLAGRFRIIRNEAGEPLALTGINFDITKRKQAEETLRMSEEKFRTLHEMSPIAIVLNRLDDGRFLESNQAMWDMTGYTEEEVRSLSYWDITPIEYKDMEAKQLELLHTVGRYGPYEKEYIRKDGTRFSVLLSGVRITDAGGTDLIYSVVQDITELKEKEDALREAKEYAENLIEAANVMVVGLDENGNVRVFNEAAEQITGYSRDELVGKNWLETLMPKHRYPRVWDEFGRMQAEGLPRTFENPILTRSGQERIVSWQNSVLRERDRITGIISFGIDITERKQAEEALRESEEQYHRLFEDDLTGDFICTPEGRILLCNPAFAEIFGFSTAQDAVGTSILDLYIDPRERESLVERLRHEGKIVRFEAWRKRHDGESIHIIENLVGHFNDQGEMDEIKGYVFDDTERKLAEDALRESEKRLVADLDAMTRLHKLGTLFVHEGNLERVLGEIVDAAIAISGADFGTIQLLDRESSCLKIMAHRGFSASWLDFWNSVSEGKGACGTALKRGERIVVEDIERSPIFVGTPALEIQLTAGVGAVQSTPLMSRSGKPLGIFSTHFKTPHRPDERSLRLLDLLARQAADIIERAQAEEALRELTLTLEARVAQRTVELEFRARQLQKLALELSQAEDRERRRLAEILHDDLQQQLAAVKFHLGILAGRARGDVGVQSSAAHLDSMLKDAIETSRSLSHELSPAVMYHGDMGEIFEWLANQIRIKHGLIVHVDPRGQIDVESDALKIFLFKAVQEMLFNAVKHARVGEAMVRVRRRGRYICLCVSDQGRGFDPQDLRQTAGFGLMSIRERIGLLGGRMRIHSVKGVGSRFIITVPDEQVIDQSAGAALRGCPPPDQATYDSLASEEGGHGGPPLRVLIADDHEVVRHGLASLLAEAADIELVGQAGNGREAVDLAYHLRPDVVIMDVAMPLMNGDEAARQILRHLPQTRIVALSMHEEAGTMERMHRAGAESYVLKTAPSEELLAAIRGE